MNLGRIVIAITIGKLATKTNKLTSEKLSGLIISNKEKPKIIPPKGIEMLFLKTTKVPIAKNIDEISRSN